MMLDIVPSWTAIVAGGCGKKYWMVALAIILIIVKATGFSMKEWFTLATKFENVVRAMPVEKATFLLLLELFMAQSQQ